MKVDVTAACPLCAPSGEVVLWRDEALRVVRVDPAEGAEGHTFPGFCRVIWHAHVAEMTDLAGADRDRLMRAVWIVEAAVRAVMRPDKINLACLGNVVPHLHWHVIPRWRDDSRFPQPIWAPAARVRPATADERLARASLIGQELTQRFQQP